MPEVIKKTSIFYKSLQYCYKECNYFWSLYQLLYFLLFIYQHIKCTLRHSFIKQLGLKQETYYLIIILTTYQKNNSNNNNNNDKNSNIKNHTNYYKYNCNNNI